MNITRVPPQTEMPLDLQFQPYQFSTAKHSYEGVASPATEISYDDSRRMGVKYSSVCMKNQRWVPAFAWDNTKLKAVILDRDRLHTRCGGVARRLASEDKKHQEAIKRAGSYRAFLAGIAYHSWHLRQDSIGVAIAMDISPVNVRQHLFKMIRTARLLGFECAPPRQSWRTLDPVEMEMLRWKRKGKEARFRRRRRRHGVPYSRRRRAAEAT